MSAAQPCADRLGVALPDCVFADDQERNVAGARALGMQTVKFDVQKPAESFDEALQKLDVLTKEHQHA